MPTLLNDVTHWRNRAEEARTVADQLADPEAKRTMHGIADSYEKLARNAEARIAARKGND
jgi:hypothetical protein